MKSLSFIQATFLCAALVILSSTFPAFQAGAAGDPPAQMTAAELAGRLSELQDGTNYIRLKMDVRASGGARSAFQIQIKERRSRSASDVLYQILWPKERKGESVLLKKSGGRSPSGFLFAPPDTMRPLGASQMKEPLFGSDLSYEDVIGNFFAWDHQALAGSETVDGVNCQILESKPGKGDQSAYLKVRSWIDVARIVPMRVEKYSASGQVARRIVTTRVVKEDKNRWIPASLTVSRPDQGSVTEIDGSKNRLDVSYSDKDFTPEGIKEVTIPRSGAE
jgi:outer membrane lipoprotein-sorting protein